MLLSNIFSLTSLILGIAVGFLVGVGVIPYIAIFTVLFCVVGVMVFSVEEPKSEHTFYHQ